MLKDDLMNLIDLLNKRKRGSLERLILSNLGHVNQPSVIKLSWYFTEMLLAFHRVISGLEVEKPAWLLERYVNTVLEGCGFLEYEIYSLLVRQGFPALPKVIFELPPSIFDEEAATAPPGEENLSEAGYSSSSVVEEIDVVVALPSSQLAVVEVTTRSHEEDARSKLEGLTRLVRQLGARAYALVDGKLVPRLRSEFRRRGVEVLPISQPDSLLEALRRGSAARSPWPLTAPQQAPA
ncbi:MAG: hypothetical protein ABWK01_06505 [Infirmifilum sp.]